MSNFVLILRNLVGSGMTNTESALIVLEAFFQSEGNELSNNAISCRSQIADLKKDLAANTKSEEQAEITFTKIKLLVLFLIDEVEKTTFDDEWAINYFAMLDPNPAYDPFFSPLKKPEKMSEEIPEETINVMPLATTKSKTNWSKRLLPIGGVLLGGLLLSNVLGYSPFSDHDDDNGYQSTPQALNTYNAASQQNPYSTQQNYTAPQPNTNNNITAGQKQANEREKQVEQKQVATATPIQSITTHSTKTQEAITNPKIEPVVKVSPPTPPSVIKPNPTSVIKSSPESNTVYKTPTPRPTVKIKNQNLENAKAPIITPKSVAKRQQTVNYQDSFKIVISNISKIKTDTLQLHNKILQLNQIQKKDAKTIESLKNQKKQLENLKRELDILNSKKAKFWNIIHGYK